jgi:predicted secreted Zn-dependent protease
MYPLIPWLKFFRARPTRLLIAVAAMMPGMSLAEVRDNLSYDYYSVNARPDRPLGAQLTEASPIREHGRKFHGHTKWNVRWRFDWDQFNDGFCRITGVSTTLQTVITLPKLTSASEQQSLRFDRYMQALREHELGHHRIGKEAAHAIDAALHEVRAARNCDALKSVAHAAARRTLDYFVDKNQQYDRETEHGRRQGASLR